MYPHRSAGAGRTRIDPLRRGRTRIDPLGAGAYLYGGLGVVGEAQEAAVAREAERGEGRQGARPEALQRPGRAHGGPQLARRLVEPLGPRRRLVARQGVHGLDGGGGLARPGLGIGGRAHRAAADGAAAADATRPPVSKGNNKKE